ncbi:MAG: histidine phosphatase family protein [Sphingomicrobium sp.]
MVRAKWLMIVMLAALAGCTSARQPSSPPDIYVMRHLNTQAGVPDPDLTGDGQRAAVDLVAWFRTRSKPAVIYVSSTRRAQQTAAPLAQSLGIAPKIYNPSDTPGLVAAVAGETGNVLVVGHSNTVPDIIGLLGGQRPVPLVHEDFGDIWLLSGSPRETERFKIAD